MHRTSTLQYQAGSDRTTIRLVQHLLQRFAYLRIDFIDSGNVRYINATARPAKNIQITMLDSFDVTIIDGDQRATLRPRFTNVAPLYIARKTIQGSSLIISRLWTWPSAQYWYPLERRPSTVHGA